MTMRMKAIQRTKARFAAISLAAVMSAVSCTENAPPKSSLNETGLVPTGIEATASNGGTVTLVSPGVISDRVPANTSPRPAVLVAPAAPKEPAVIAPKDAKWTIFCTVIGGAGHTQRAAQFKSDLAAATNSDKWYVVHEDDKSSIYYGFYHTIERGTREGETAQADKQRIAALKNAAGELPLQLCSFLPIDHAAPAAPAEWDLGSYTRNPQHFWSVQIAAYTADASDSEGHDRKWAAVESVKALRAAGVPAYFSHGDSVSTVCVGMWPETAVKKQTGGNEKGNAGSQNPESALFVSNVPFPEGTPNKDPEGHRLEKMSPKVEIVDRSLYETMQKFPSHMVNSVERYHKVKDVRTGVISEAPEPTFLVMVPEAGTVLTPGGQRQMVDPGQLPLLPPALLQTDQPSAPKQGVGKLREVGR
jgi:hypothetical protein